MGALFLCAVVLSIDSFLASTALSAGGMPRRIALAMSLSFGFCDGIASLAGLSVGSDLAERLGNIGHCGGVILLAGYIAFVLCIIRFSTQQAGRYVAAGSWWLFVIPVLMSLDNLTATYSLNHAYPPLVEASVFGLLSGVGSWIGFIFASAVSDTAARLSNKLKLVHGARIAKGLLVIGAGIALIFT